MEEQTIIYQKRNMSWLGIRTLGIVAISFVMSIISLCISSLASSRKAAELLSAGDYSLVDNSIEYCFAVFAITLASLLLIDVKYTVRITFFQFSLIGAALTLFYLLLLSFSEFIPFIAAYALVTVMTVGLISLFIKAISKNFKAFLLTVGIIVVEYAYILVLLYMGRAALLLGSLALFVLIAVAMCFTLRMKIVNGELTIN